MKATTFVILLFLIFFTSCKKKQNAPNIVFILVDDLSWADLGYMGSSIYETPNIDKLSREGMQFSDFYSAGPVCSPTRASILTGKYPVRTGITTYLLNPERDPDYISQSLDTSEYTIAEAFRSNGYRTGYFGKWHLGFSKTHWALNQGFDVAKGGMDLPWAWKIAHPDKEIPIKEGHTRFFSPHHLTFLENGSEGEYLTDRLTNESISFMKENKEDPFFLFLSFHTVHTPLQVKVPIFEKYRKKINSLGLLGIDSMQNGSRRYQNLPEYAGMVHHMDENVGRLLKAIDSLGLEQNTIVVFTSDNGGKATVTSNAPLRGAKHQLDEGGIRVPTIVKWPGKIMPGSNNQTPLVSNDFFPTLLDLCSLAPVPEKHLDGLSFKPQLLAGKVSQERSLYFHYPHNRFEGALRKGDYKLQYFYKRDSICLYNLQEDIGEAHDLSEKFPDLANNLKSELIQWLKEVKANFPDDLKHIIQD